MAEDLVPVGSTGKVLRTQDRGGRGLDEIIVISDATDPDRKLLVNADGSISVAQDEVDLPISVTATDADNTVVHAPAAGNAVRLWWYQMSARSTNSAEVVAGLRFGDAGTLFGTTPLSQFGGSIAHHFRDGRAYVQGAVDATLFINLTAAQTVYVTVETEEITP